MELQRHGTRQELISELRHVAEGCLGSDHLRHAASRAVEALDQGESVVTVGRTRYEVTGDV